MPQEGTSTGATRRKTAWGRLRIWLYREGTAREVTSLEALSALSTWRSGRVVARVSFVAGARVLSDPEQVDWEDFPEGEALEAEGEAPTACAPASKAPVSRRTTRPQLAALRVIDGAPGGLDADAVHQRRARALLLRGLIEQAIVEGRAVLRSSTTGRALLTRVDAQLASRPTVAAQTA